MSLFLNIATPAKFAFCRGYLAGYELDVNAPLGVTLTDATMDYTDQFGVRYAIVLPDYIAEWNSNYYTLDFTVDLPASHAYIGTTEVISGVYTTMGHILNERGLWLKFQSGGGSGTKYLHPLPPPPPDYWSPL